MTRHSEKKIAARAKFRDKLLESSNPVVAFLTKMAMFFKIKMWAFIEWITAALRRMGVRWKKYEWLKQYKNKYDGKRCFIVATGPSLTVEDLSLLKNEITFGMNSICMSSKLTDWIPTFFGVQDQNVYRKIKDSLENYPCENIFVGSTVSFECDIKDSYKEFPMHTRYHLFEGDYLHKNFAKFSDDCYAVVYDGFTITYSLIQLAIYFGFKEIYLLGADCNYEVGKPQHFIEHGSDDKNIAFAKERMFVSYEVAKKYADTHGIKIYNATRGGKLEIFPRVKLEDVINGE